MHATANGAPTKDTLQDVELLSATEFNGITTIKFRRKLDTCDEEQDRIITVCVYNQLMNTKISEDLLTTTSILLLHTMLLYLIINYEYSSFTHNVTIFSHQLPVPFFYTQCYYI